MRRILVGGLIGAAYLYVLLVWGIWFGERGVTYHPDPTRTAPAAAGLAGVRERIIVTPDGMRLVAWQADARPGAPTILFFHGNANALAYRAGRVRAFQAQGYGVLMVAYRGYAGSTGWPSEAAIIADAALAYRTLVGDGVAAESIVIYGESLGTSVAVQTAVAHQVRAVILEAPFTSMVDAWRQFAPWLPVGILLRDRFDSRAVIGRLRAPLLVLHGERDRLVGIDLGRRLFEAAPPPKRFAAFPTAKHDDLYAHDAIRTVRSFLDDVASRRIMEARPGG
jgi:fermentation-respiration switch protein FrsA (DUF1100 family)